MPESVSKGCQKRCQKECHRINVRRGARMSERMSRDMLEGMSERMSERCQKECQRENDRKQTERMSEEVSKIVRKNVRRYARKNVRMDAQQECQKRCQKECRRKPLLHLVNRLYNTRRMTSCGIEWLPIQTDSFDHTSNINVQFTSNYEDYMHRGEHPITQAWCSNIKKLLLLLQIDLGISCERKPSGFQRTSTDYGARNQSSKVCLGDHVISFDYDADY